MSSRDETLTRRRFVLGTIGLPMALAGCVGNDAPVDGGDTDRGSGEATGTAAEEGSTVTARPATSTGTRDSAKSTSDATTTQTSTQTVDDETTTDGPESVCAPLAASPTTYDASGTSYIFVFDYPETWTVGEPIPGQSGRFQQITSPAVSVDGSSRTATVRIGQSLPALSASAVEAEKDGLVTRETDPYAVVDEQTFAGETVEVLGFADVPPSNYPPTYTLYLPYRTGDNYEYYRTSIVTYSDIYGLDDEERDSCNELIRTATETVRSGLRPNPETTVEDA